MPYIYLNKLHEYIYIYMLQNIYSYKLYIYIYKTYMCIYHVQKIDIISVLSPLMWLKSLLSLLLV